MWVFEKRSKNHFGPGANLKKLRIQRDPKLRLTQNSKIANKLGLSWAKLSLSWGLRRILKPERLHLGLGLIG